MIRDPLKSLKLPNAVHGWVPPHGLTGAYDNASLLIYFIWLQLNFVFITLFIVAFYGICMEFMISFTNIVNFYHYYEHVW